MIRILVPTPLSEALDAADARLRSLSTILQAAPDRPAARVWIMSRDALEETVRGAVERFERGELGAEAAALEVLRALAAGVEDSTQPG